MNPTQVLIILPALLVVTSATPIVSGEHNVREYEDWRHDSNDEMIEALKKFGHIASPVVEGVMRSIDRRRFIERPIMNNPYWDIPQSLGFGSVMSSPKVHAQALEILKDHLRPGARVLDIGSGSGYLTACMAHMVGPTGKVFAVEHIEDLVEQANKSMNTYYPTLTDRVHWIAGDGRQGHKEGAPYDVIYVGGAVHHYPYHLFSQINVNGRLLVWVGHSKAKQRLFAVDKKYDYSNKFVGNLTVSFTKLGKSKMNEYLVDQDEQMVKFYDTVKNNVDSVEHEMLYAYND